LPKTVIRTEYLDSKAYSGNEYEAHLFKLLRYKYEKNNFDLILAAASPAPIFGGWEFNLGHGIVGGKLIDLFAHGVLAGRLAVEILQGKAFAPGFGLFPSPNSFMFDDRLLKRFQIGDERLPPASKIINRPPSFYQKNRAEIFILLSGLLAALVAGVFIYIYNSRARLRKAYGEKLAMEKTLLASQAQLR